MTTVSKPSASAAPTPGKARFPRRPPVAGWVPISILVLTAALAVAATGFSRASAGTRNWIAPGWSIHLLDQAQPGTAAHFFNTPGSYGTGGNRSAGPVLDGFRTTPVLVYSSYAQFASDVSNGAISPAYHWVLYDPEYWPQTPVAEQQDPYTYLRLFGQLAHAHGYQVIEAPARDLGLAAAAVCPKRVPETLNQWYVRCNIPGAAAPYSDVLVVQDQVNTTSLVTYQWLFTQARQEALAASPHAVVDSELSTNYGTADQMAAAARSVPAAGFYVNMPDIGIASQFFAKMQAAGY